MAEKLLAAILGEMRTKLLGGCGGVGGFGSGLWCFVMASVFRGLEFLDFRGSAPRESVL